MRAELTHLFSINAVSLIDRPPGANVIGCTWAHRFKYDADGNYTRAKSRICPYGFQQIPGVDYNEDGTSAPTLAIEHAMFLLALQVQRDMHAILLDADSAFATTPNSVPVYMRLPDGLERQPGKVLRLNHALNGTKQGAFDWYTRAAGALVRLGFTPCVTDPCIFYRWDDKSLSLCGLYVDDFRFLSDDLTIFDTISNALKGMGFKMKAPDPNWWLGMKLDHNRTAGTLAVTQSQYTKDLLQRFGMSDCKPCDTPAAPGTKLTKTSTPPDPLDTETCNFDYRGAVGSLLWLARTTRPDILYAVNQPLSRDSR